MPAANESMNGTGSAERLTNTKPCQTSQAMLHSDNELAVDFVGGNVRCADQPAVE